jgi:RNA-directed DNA polymerase
MENAMDQPTETKLSSVPNAKQEGEVLLRWSWTESAVWTERMLIALENGVKGGVWFSLMDKVFRPQNLLSAFQRVASRKGAAGVDHVSVEEFGNHLPEEVEKLTKVLREGTYRPQAIRRVHIPKPGSDTPRPLGIPTVRDRLVQGALRHVLEPIFEKEFATHSYGFRPKRGCKDALRRVDALLKEGYEYVVDVDLKSYFDTIPHDRLMQRVQERVADGKVLSLIESFLQARVLDGLEEWQPEAGAPQGAVLSPLLSNIYLNPLDHQMAKEGFEMVRYADDMVVLCRSQAEAEAALSQIAAWCEAEGLTLNAEKTRLVELKEGFDFLGYHFTRSRKDEIVRWPSKKSMAGLKSRIRSRTKRCNGHSLSKILSEVNETLVGWFGYFRHSYRWTFGTLDSWVRMRLRSILRKRQGGRGRGRGSDHQRWPNSYFAERGYYSLKSAFAELNQSPCG